jgi:hypothetical protein
MASRAEIRRKYATAFKAASKAQKTVFLDQVCEVTGWSRGLRSETLTSPGPGPIRKMTKRPSSRKTITWSANTPTTGVMTLRGR